MKSQLLYIELKTGFNDNGPAWIGKGFFSKTGQTVYFNGQAFKKAKGVSGNHFEIESGDEYWISGIKKNGTDRHWAGSGIIQIDESILSDYLNLIGQTSLTKNKFKIVKLNNNPPISAVTEIENRKLDE
ncbi:MAG: hypothetical protein ACHQNT_09880 [Bacteroidia bacterium]